MRAASRMIWLLAALSILAACNPQEENPQEQEPSFDLSFAEGPFTKVSQANLKLAWESIVATEMKISENTNCSGGVWEPASNSKVITLSETEGKKSYSAQVRNSAGTTTECATASLTYDHTSPTGKILLPAALPLTNNRVSLGLEASDNLAVLEMAVQESNNCSTLKWEVFSGQVTLNLSSGDGSKSISAIFKDGAGNLSACYVTSVTVKDDPSSNIEDGRLHTDGKYLKDDQGNVIVLRGVNIADPQHLDTKPNERPGISAMSVAQNAVNNFKVNVIRIPVLPGSGGSEGWFSKSTGGEKYYNEHLKNLVEWITDQKVYVIIDLHYISDYSSLQSKVLEFWTAMAPKFANNPYVIYEVFNEPINPDSWSTWKSTIAQPAVNKIRQYAPNNLIIVGGPGWSSHMAGAASDPVTGSNILYTCHIYSNQVPQKWEDRFGELTKKYPVFVTEWGFEEGGTEGGTASGYGIPFLAWIEARGLSWTAWAFDTVWGPRMFDKNWNLLDGNGGMGVFVQEALEKNP